MKKWILLATIVLLFIGGGIFAYYHFVYYPAFVNFKALCATQFVHLPAITWHDDFVHNRRELPAAYPRNLNDLVDFGYTDSITYPFYSKYCEIRYFQPPDDADSEFIITDASTAYGTWACTIGFSRIWHPIKAEQGAAANP